MPVPERVYPPFPIPSPPQRLATAKSLVLDAAAPLPSLSVCDFGGDWDDADDDPSSPAHQCVVLAAEVARLQRELAALAKVNTELLAGLGEVTGPLAHPVAEPKAVRPHPKVSADESVFVLSGVVMCHCVYSTLRCISVVMSVCVYMYVCVPVCVVCVHLDVVCVFVCVVCGVRASVYVHVCMWIISCVSLCPFAD